MLAHFLNQKNFNCIFVCKINHYYLAWITLLMAKFVNLKLTKSDIRVEKNYTLKIFKIYLVFMVSKLAHGYIMSGVFKVSTLLIGSIFS